MNFLFLIEKMPNDIHTCSNGISAMRNVNGLVKDLNSDRLVK